MYIGYLLFVLVTMAALFWAFYRLPNDDASSNDDEDGGTYSGGDSYPVDPPPSLVVNTPDRERIPDSSAAP